MSLDQLKKTIAEYLPELDMVIGWEQGMDGLNATPLFIRNEKDLEKLVGGPLRVHNLASYLPRLKGKKVGIVAKGCDSRAIVQLLVEKLVDRKDITIFGMACPGIVSHAKLREKAGDITLAKDITVTDDTVSFTIDGKEHSYALNDVCADKCLTCAQPDPVVCDHFAGAESTRTKLMEKSPAQEAFEAMSVEEKNSMWQQEMRRCLRCYACRNACPMCVCKDHCIAVSRDPHWTSQENSPRENFMFQLIHTMHLAGRCVECGECERACPMDIPVLHLRRAVSGTVKELFDFSAGMNEDDVPPLMTFKIEEANIKD